jgi:glycosyltransferase involved in cell wall biosynthesis
MSAARPRIALYQPYPHTLGGLQTVVIQLAKRLPDFGYEAVVICPEPGAFTAKLRDERIEFQLSEPGAAWHVYGHGARSLRYALSTRRMSALPAYWRQLRRDLHTQGIALLHCNDYRAVMLAAPAARLAGIPAIWHMHGFVPSRLINALAATLANWTVPVSRGMLDYVRLPRPWLRRCEVIHNGVEAPLSEETPAESSPLKPRVLAVGTLHPRKGYETLLRAFREVVTFLPEAECHILGGEFADGAYGRQLRELRDRLGLQPCVHFLGHSQEVAAHLRRCSLLAVPSRVEAFGLVAVEAMLAGKPVVACRTGGLQDIVRDGETGFLIEPENAAQMAEGIVRLLREPALALRLGRAGRARAQACFTVEQMVGRFAGLYARVLGARAGLESRQAGSVPPTDPAPPRSQNWQPQRLAPDKA